VVWRAVSPSFVARVIASNALLRMRARHHVRPHATPAPRSVVGKLLPLSVGAVVRHRRESDADGGARLADVRPDGAGLGPRHGRPAAIPARAAVDADRPAPRGT